MGQKSVTFVLLKVSDLEKKETAYSKTIQEADTIMARLMIVIMMVWVEMTRRGSTLMIIMII